MSNELTYPGKSDKMPTKRVKYTGTDQLKEGYLLCYNRDYGTAATAELNRANVEKPSTDNLHWFAGVIAPGVGVTTSGEAVVEIYEPGTLGLCNIWTEETCVVGVTMLALKPSSYAAGAAFEGAVIGIARQTADRSSTNGTVMAELWGLPKLTPQARTHTAAGRGFSPAIWEPYESTIQRILLGDFTLGTVFQTDFIKDFGGTSATTTWNGDWLVTLATGTCTRGITADGTVILTATATDDQGAQIQASTYTVTPAANTTILFECRAKYSSITALAQLFLGMGTIDTTIHGSGVLSCTNYIGWFQQETIVTAGYLNFGSCKATTAEDLNDAFAMAADTYFKVGFVVNGVTTLTGYANGAAVTAPAIAVATHLPLAAIVPSFSCQGENTDAGLLTIDWMRAAYLT